MMTELDCRGLACPQPVVRTKQALEAMPSGDLVVLVSSPESAENVRRFAESQGCKVTVREGAGCFYVDITKSACCLASGKPVGAAVAVLIASARMGIGDERLGEILMKSFLNTLWDAEPKPEKLILINSGVTLATEGSEVLDTLKLIEEKGVVVLCCGTCLEYYNLREKLMVGRVSNMHEIVTSLLAAGRVIRI
jgi:selenium metabolism protein YedF